MFIKTGVFACQRLGDVDMHIYTTFTNFSMKYHMMCKVYTDVGGIK